MNLQLEKILYSRDADPDGIYGCMQNISTAQSEEVELRERVAAERYDNYPYALSASHSIPVMDHEVDRFLAAILLRHATGYHTRTRARLSDVASLDGLEREITSSADSVEQLLGVSIDHFSYTFGSLASFSEKALAVARRRFRFIYSGSRGDNAQGVSPFALRRDSAEFLDAHSNYMVFSNRLLGAFLEGAEDTHYASSRAVLDVWNLRE